MVNDFFLQTSIDFLLGNVTAMVFEEFEADMMTKDPAVSMSTMREQAIELCQKRVISDDGEDFVGGWTLLSPRTPDSVAAHPFEEVVLLLTDAALYLCRFDWNLDKVSSFERVELSHVTRIRFGTYITSTMSAAQTDEMRNVGLVVSYRPGKDDVMRINTRSLSSLTTLPGRAANGGGATHALAGLLGRSKATPNQDGSPIAEKKIALKALYAQTSSSVAKPGSGRDEGPRLSEIQLVVSICAEIERLALKSKPVFKTGGGEGEEPPPPTSLIEKGDIISVAEAKKSTGLLEQWSHSLKKMVWA